MKYKVTRRRVSTMSGGYGYIRVHLDGKHVSVYKATDKQGKKFLMYYMWETSGHEIESPDMDEYFVPELLVELSEEEMFQKSVVWNYPVDLYLFRKIQEYYEVHGFPEDDREIWEQEFGDTE